MKTEQEVWERYYRHLNIQGTDWDINDPIIVADLEWVLYIGRDHTITPPENEFEDGKRIGGMKDEISIREGVKNKELRDWLLDEVIRAWK